MRNKRLIPVVATGESFKLIINLDLLLIRGRIYELAARWTRQFHSKIEISKVRINLTLIAKIVKLSLARYCKLSLTLLCQTYTAVAS